MKSSRKPLAILFLVALATLAIYLRTLSFDFVAYDDGVYVTDNVHVREGLTWNGVVYAFTSGDTATWQPLAMLSHMLDCSLYGLNAGGHHATSAIFHALNTFLLGLVLLRMTGAAGPSLFVAAVFGLHPLHVESVAWVSERKDVLSTFFFMATLYAYAVWAETIHKKWLLLATTAMALGLLAKPMLVTLPFVLLLLDYWPLHRVDDEKRLRCIGLLIAEKLPMFMLAAAVSVATIAVQRAAQATSSLAALPLVLRLENAAVAYVRYLGKFLWPADLLMYYPHSREGIGVAAVGGALCVLLAMTVAAWLLRRRARYVSVGWFWYLGTLVPVIGIVQVGAQAIADRYMYIPMIGILIIVAWGAREILAGFNAPVVRGAAVIVIALLSWRTWDQIGVWRDSETLYRHTIAIMPKNAFANMGLGLLRIQQHRYTEAIVPLEIAVEARHREAEAEYHLGMAYQGLLLPQRALPHYERAIALDGAYSQAWNNLGVTLDALGKRAEALGAFQKAANIHPGNLEAVENVGSQLIRLGTPDEAERYLRAKVASNPSSANLLYVLGMALWAQQKNTEALESFRAVLAIRPDYPGVAQLIEAIGGSKP